MEETMKNLDSPKIFSSPLPTWGVYGTLIRWFLVCMHKVKTALSRKISQIERSNAWVNGNPTHNRRERWGIPWGYEWVCMAFTPYEAGAFEDQVWQMFQSPHKSQFCLWCGGDIRHLPGALPGRLQIKLCPKQVATLWVYETQIFQSPHISDAPQWAGSLQLHWLHHKLV